MTQHRHPQTTQRLTPGVWLIFALVVSTLVSFGSSAAPVSAAGGYTALTPARVLDTRTGVGAPQARVGAGGRVDLKVTGVAGIPETGVAAVVLNVTAINPDTKTFLTVWPTGQPKPATSNLNAPAGATIPNLVIATVGADGKVSIANEFGTIDIAADVTGWYPTGSDYNALTPARVLDTRTGTGAPRARVGAGGRVDLQVTGSNGIPETGVAAVVLNVTAINPDTKTFLTVWPTGQPKPATSNLNAPTGATIPNLVIATVGADGKVAIANEFGTIDIAADVTGWYATGSDYNALTPARVLDTRTGVGAPRARVAAGGRVDLKVTGTNGIPETGVAAVVLNVTAINPDTKTFLTVWPTGQAKPATSNLNTPARATIPNLVIATVGTDGKVSIANEFGTIDIAADITGWIPGTPASTDRGTLIGVGNSTAWEWDLDTPTDDWLDRGFQYDEFAIASGSNELIRGSVGPTQPFLIEARNLDTFTVTDNFVWPSDAWGVDDLKATDDGAYLAARVQYGDLSTGLEVLRRSDRTVVSTGLDDVLLSMAWTPRNDLVVSVDLSGAGGSAQSGIGVIPLASLEAGGNFDFPIYTTFTSSEGNAGGLSVSPNGSEIVFNRSGSLYVMDLRDGAVPHQLTTGPQVNEGAHFSPDGSQVAFAVTSLAAGFQSQYIIPNTRGAPIEIDRGKDKGGQYLLDEDNLVTGIEAWLP